ncbi:MAG: Fpg/Nei family DNA glycosylase [Pirellula sp.]
MPELPEVETMRRGLFPAIGGKITRIDFPINRYRPIVMSPTADRWPTRIKNRSIIGIERIAKRVLIRLDNDDRIVLQPKMAGLTLISDPPTAEHVRLTIFIENASCDRIIYWDRRGLGTAHVWSAEECQLHLGPTVLGPDALIITENDFYHRFSKLNRPVKPALLDQRLVAGVGNLYASEILHRAGIDPRTLCRKISKPKWLRIHQWMLQILLQAIENEGSTLGDGTYRNAINGEGGFQHFHLVYDRKGQTCKTCESGTIQRIVQSQRSTFYCPKCQKRS